jgi:hypothetical protein
VPSEHELPSHFLLWHLGEPWVLGERLPEGREDVVEIGLFLREYVAAVLLSPPGRSDSGYESTL